MKARSLPTNPPIPAAPTPPARVARPILALLSALVLCTSCSEDGGGRERVLLVTTTTVEDSGLLERLVDAYHAGQSAYRLSTTAMGSGAALALGRSGDADLLLTHDPEGEARFMAEGHGIEQGPVMVNEFVVAGPAADPAGVGGATDLPGALRRIADGGALFVSRGDDSGTHRRELGLWARSGRAPHRSRPEWYVEAAVGMAEALRVADERDAYILTDASTFRHLSDRLRLEALLEGDPAEPNPYSYTVPAGAPNAEGARDLRDWLLGAGQAVIADHGRERFGESLFRPAAATSP